MSIASITTVIFRPGVAPRASHRANILLLGAALALPASSALAGACHPVLLVKETQFSEIKDLQRVWHATLDIDASRCAAGAGLFSIRVVRAKEDATDLPSSERFTWRAGRSGFSLGFWAEEAGRDYEIVQIELPPCSCKE
jgi:hypothetical protein